MNMHNKKKRNIDQHGKSLIYTTCLSFPKDDRWRPMNHLNEKDCGKFVDDMAAVGIDLKEFVYGEYTLENRDIHIIL